MSSLSLFITYATIVDGMTTPEQESRLHIVFVCTGNICRSPMAEVIARDCLESAGLDKVARVSSCGLGGWHVGQGADERAIAELRKSGHDGSQHRAAKLEAKHQEADLLIALDESHFTGLMEAGVAPEKIRLLRSFDPQAQSPDVEDPYYGKQVDFAITRENIQGAMPGLMEWVRENSTTNKE